MKPNFTKYKEASRLFKSVLYKYDEKFEEIGLDEANLDCTEYIKKHKLNDDMGRIFLAQKIR